MDLDYGSRDSKANSSFNFFAIVEWETDLMPDYSNELDVKPNTK